MPRNCCVNWVSTAILSSLKLLPTSGSFNSTEKGCFLFPSENTHNKCSVSNMAFNQQMSVFQRTSYFYERYNPDCCTMMHNAHWKLAGGLASPKGRHIPLSRENSYLVLVAVLKLNANHNSKLWCTALNENFQEGLLSQWVKNPITNFFGNSFLVFVAVP